jgi:hypothetical protein
VDANGNFATGYGGEVATQLTRPRASVAVLVGDERRLSMMFGRGAHMATDGSSTMVFSTGVLGSDGVRCRLTGSRRRAAR